jgi:hypothetical protein
MMVEVIFDAEKTDEDNDPFCRFRKKKHKEMHESTGNGGDADKSELGNNLYLVTVH